MRRTCLHRSLRTALSPLTGDCQWAPRPAAPRPHPTATVWPMTVTTTRTTLTTPPTVDHPWPFVHTLGWEGNGCYGGFSLHHVTGLSLSFTLTAPHHDYRPLGICAVYSTLSHTNYRMVYQHRASLDDLHYTDYHASPPQWLKINPPFLLCSCPLSTPSPPLPPSFRSCKASMLCVQVSSAHVPETVGRLLTKNSPS